MATETAASRAETLKIQGNQSLRTGGFGEAIVFYSRAIELTPDNHVLFSNRALAHLKLRQYAKALEDADRCIALNAQFVKAYSTKGTALTWLNRYQEAKAAYAKGLEIDPTHATIKANLESLKARPTQQAPPAAASSSLVAFLMNDKVTTLQSFVRLFMLLSAVLYVIPFFPATFAFSRYRQALMACMAHALFNVFRVAGRPRFSAEYAARAFANPATHQFFTALMFFTARPRALALVPLLSLEAVFVAEFLYNVALRISSPLAAAMAGVGAKWGKSLSGNPNFAGLSYQGKWAAVSSRVLEWSALGTVMVGLVLIFELFTPNRNFLLLFMYWQMLQVQYMTSDHIKKAFRLVDARILSLTAHRLCPSIINKAYVYVRGWLAKRVTPPAPGQQPSTPRCTIM